MNMPQIKEVAKKMGVKSNGLKKTELIRSIQCSEGNDPCYETGQVKTCGQFDCLWKDDCK